jgi:ribose transport system permease protein
MNKLVGIFVFLVILYGAVVLGTPGDWFNLTATDWEALKSNHRNLGQRVGLEGILCLGAGLLIITGGIDLSIGSVVSLCACVFCQLVLDLEMPIPIAAIVVILLGAGIGLVNGFLVTRFQVQAFVVTLCGLFLYRGAARWITNDKIPVIAEAVAPISDFCRGSILFVPVYLWFLLLLVAVATLFLHFTIYGRYFCAIGSNERAARYSGIQTNLYKILAYVLCSMFAAVYALMHVVHYNTVEPSTTGNFLELYAIAGAVLGGCSLRGGEGTTIGMLIGTAIMRLLPNMTNMWQIPSTLEPTVIGAALLLCAILDELLRRGADWRDLLGLVGIRIRQWSG